MHSIELIQINNHYKIKEYDKIKNKKSAKEKKILYFDNNLYLSIYINIKRELVILFFILSQQLSEILYSHITLIKHEKFKYFTKKIRRKKSI
ncbi:hypothetical protein TRFO_33689 [Tritrichomonas foetus]|uniref:Uncharacterized protein n=1 Tax=Tritrichomonas foetus TaxID=1144522 RepID=A0A1J4JQH0_9EUKA|nr:hypothetical protein TRFO_33689 [Tritrichomonas foetus]|eukprot:OHS99773.1 hypothetical protein TRFO_33689 [Tritrichomonas foetus]